MKKLFAVFLFLLTLIECFAQGPIITPLNSNAALAKAVQKSTGLKRAVNDTIDLPFFDDFTSTNVYPDKTRWADNKVYVNSHFAVSPMSYGVATFDNLDPKGKPYFPLSGTTRGASDSLTCKPINLKTFILLGNPVNYTVADSIYLSFFFQPQGLGDILDGTDSLVLKFKDTGENWNTVWKTSGSKIKPFRQILVGIKSAKYLYKGFQFSFINFTKNTGNMNQWHVDYIRMKRGRSAKDTSVEDIAINKVPEGPLQWYETLPYSHFKANPSYNLMDSTSVRIRNNNVGAYNVEYAYQVRNQYSKIIFDIPSTSSGRNVLGLSDTSEKFAKVKLDTFSGKQPKVTFKYTVLPKATLTSDFLQGNYGANNANNEYIKTLQFKNYFAYDDGSAEGGFGLDYSSLPAGPGYAALRFQTFLPDTLRGISVFFNQSVVDVSSKSFDLMVWKKISEPPANNMNGDVLFRKLSVTFPTYLDTINGFVDYIFDTAVVLPQGQFYIGWKQLTPFVLNVGYDNNYQYGKQKEYRNPNLFFNLMGYWEKVSASITGVPMMRPIVGDKVKTNIPGSIKGIETGTARTAIYPNPSNGLNILNIQSPINIISIKILDMTGKEVFQQDGESIQTINVSSLSSGLYSIILTDERHNTNNQKYIKTE